ncbi:hypothetical protein, partial [uncultured Fretibacterium sp.]|uniref:hypothetical protein n=1 Tax=uncultured Fretibacterium sp. TaxID=1678694 RepID=UPI0026371327
MKYENGTVSPRCNISSTRHHRPTGTECVVFRTSRPEQNGAASAAPARRIDAAIRSIISRRVEERVAACQGIPFGSKNAQYKNNNHVSRLQLLYETRPFPPCHTGYLCSAFLFFCARSSTRA